jgi:hypothetical protein
MHALQYYIHRERFLRNTIVIAEIEKLKKKVLIFKST